MQSPVLKLVITVAVLIVSTGIYLALADSEYLRLFTEPNMLVANIRDMGIMGPILIIGLMSIAIVNISGTVYLFLR